MDVAPIDPVDVLDVEVVDLNEIRNTLYQFPDDASLPGRHPHDLADDHVNFLMFFDVLLQEGHHLQLKLYLFFLVFSLEDGDVRLRAFYDELLEKLDIYNQNLLYFFDLDRWLMLYQIFVLIFNKKEILIDDLPEGMRLPLKLPGQCLLLSHITKQFLKHALLVLLLHLA